MFGLPSYYSRMKPEMQLWCQKNQDELGRLWEENLSEIRCSDSLEHCNYMAGSDDCYYEFCEEVYEKTGGVL